MWKFLCKFFYFEWHLVVKNETIRIAFNRSSLIRFGLNGEKKIINSSNIVRSADCGVQIERFIEPKSIVNYLMKTIFFKFKIAVYIIARLTDTKWTLKHYIGKILPKVRVKKRREQRIRRTWTERIRYQKCNCVFESVLIANKYRIDYKTMEASKTDVYCRSYVPLRIYGQLIICERFWLSLEKNFRIDANETQK